MKLYTDLDNERTQRIAQLLGEVPLPQAAAVSNEPHLVYDAQGLAMVQGEMLLRGDFREMLSRLRKQNLEHELLVKACRIKNKPELSVLDATAGLGQDSLLLAAVGFRVTMCERDPVIFAMLEDTLHRAASVPELVPVIRRMELIQGDSVELMRNGARADVIFLDPMFPERTKSAAVKKKFQLLHKLEAPCDEEERLFTAAKETNPLKIVVKRPLKGDYLAGVKPAYSLSGKAIRVDCYINIY